jgi:heat shock protein HtpX
MTAINRTKSMLLLAALTALFLWIGSALGGRGGLAISLLLAGAMNVGAYWFSDRIVLRMYGAREVGRDEAPGLYGMVQQLAMRAELPMPRVYTIPEAAPNAFATGRKPRHASVAVTEGLAATLNRDELAGVIAHELGHIRNRDTLIMTVSATIAGALSHLANMAMWGALFGGRQADDEEGGHRAMGIVGVMLAPLLATVIQLAISRAREFGADEAGARISGDPLALASALRKLERSRETGEIGQANPATAHLFIVNPFSGVGLWKLFSTHPPSAERIARLEAIAARQTQALAW